MRMNDEKLQIIGIENSSHRYEILKEIYKQVFIWGDNIFSKIEF